VARAVYHAQIRDLEITANAGESIGHRVVRRLGQAVRCPEVAVE
jgi:hypothetical protein